MITNDNKIELQLIEKKSENYIDNIDISMKSAAFTALVTMAIYISCLMA